MWKSGYKIVSIDCPIRRKTQNFTLHYKAQLYSKNHEKIYTAKESKHKHPHQALEQKHSTKDQHVSIPCEKTVPIISIFSPFL